MPGGGARGAAASHFGGGTSVIGGGVRGSGASVIGGGAGHGSASVIGGGAAMTVRGGGGGMGTSVRLGSVANGGAGLGGTASVLPGMNAGTQAAPVSTVPTPAVEDREIAAVSDSVKGEFKSALHRFSTVVSHTIRQVGLGGRAEVGRGRLAPLPPPNAPHCCSLRETSS